MLPMLFPQAPDDTWAVRELQNAEETRKQMEAKEAKRLYQEAEQLPAKSQDATGKHPNIRARKQGSKAPKK